MLRHVSVSINVYTIDIGLHYPIINTRTIIHKYLNFRSVLNLNLPVVKIGNVSKDYTFKSKFVFSLQTLKFLRIIINTMPSVFTLQVVKVGRGGGVSVNNVTG